MAKGPTYLISLIDGIGRNGPKDRAAFARICSFSQQFMTRQCGNRRYHHPKDLPVNGQCQPSDRRRSHKERPGVSFHFVKAVADRPQSSRFSALYPVHDLNEYKLRSTNVTGCRPSIAITAVGEIAPLGISDKIDGFFIALGRQHHILRPMARKEGVFLQDLLNPDKPNLAMADCKASDTEKNPGSQNLLTFFESLRHWLQHFRCQWRTLARRPASQRGEATNVR